MSALHQLDADEVLAIRENVQSAKTSQDGPPSRCLPEGLCVEIEKLLELLELEIRNQDKPSPES